MKRKLTFSENSPLYLGIGANHDFTACLVRDGKIVTAIEAERINRIKHSVDSFNPFQSVLKYLFLDAVNEINSLATCDTFNIKNIIEYSSKVELYNHHLCHASAVFYTSPFEHSAILVMDGLGSREQLDDGTYTFETVSMYTGTGKEISLIKKISGIMGEEINERHNHHLDIPNSLGIFYTYITKIVGFNFLEDGKTMGLASYGNPEIYYETLKKHIQYCEDGLVSITLSDKDYELYKNKINEEKDDSKNFINKANFTAAGQKILEEIFFHYVNHLHQLTGQENICIGGGVALNSLANGKLLKNSKFKNIHIFPACGDDSIAVGAAYLSYYKKETHERVLLEKVSPFLGKNYSEEEILESLGKFPDIQYYKSKNKYIETANFLNQNKIIAWFQGESEIGPRALGHRSILAHPGHKDTKDYINKTIKQREGFRPFAPSILRKYQEKYFESDFYSPNMLFVIQAKDENKDKIKAVVHVDGTARVQSVSEDNCEFYNLLTEFNKISGLPLLLNTSFNIIRGEPIVETPYDALTSFNISKIDYLVLGDFICKRLP